MKPPPREESESSRPTKRPKRGGTVTDYYPCEKKRIQGGESRSLLLPGQRSAKTDHPGHRQKQHSDREPLKPRLRLPEKKKERGPPSMNKPGQEGTWRNLKWRELLKYLEIDNQGLNHTGALLLKKKENQSSFGPVQNRPAIDTQKNSRGVQREKNSSSPGVRRKKTGAPSISRRRSREPYRQRRKETANR